MPRKPANRQFLDRAFRGSADARSRASEPAWVASRSKPDVGVDEGTRDPGGIFEEDQTQRLLQVGLKCTFCSVAPQTPQPGNSCYRTVEHCLPGAGHPRAG